MTSEAEAGLLGLIDAVDLPILVLGRDATLVHCNAAARTFLSLIPSDVGRSLRHARILDGLIAGIEELCEQAMASRTATQRQVRMKDGSWFVVRTNPYLGADRRVAGAVVTFTNITGLYASVEQAIYEREYTKTILNTVVTPLVVLDAELRVRSANRAFYVMFQISREKAQGMAFQDLGKGDWDTLALAARFRQCLSGADEQTEALETHIDLPQVGRRTLSLNARRMPRDARRREMIVVSIEDITDRRQAEEALRAAGLRKDESWPPARGPSTVDSIPGEPS